MSTTTEHTLEQSLDKAQEIIRNSERSTREESFKESVVAPPVVEVTLPGGFYDFDGSVSTDAEVRELTGWDEEVIARIAAKEDGTAGEVLVAILDRCVVRIGGETEIKQEVLNMLFAGDWDALLLGIRIASYGSEVRWQFPCQICEEDRVVFVDLEKDVQRRTLDPDAGTTFEWHGKRSSYVVGYPRGSTSRKMLTSKPGARTTSAGAVSDLLYGSIESIDGKPVRSINEIKAMPTMDREAILVAITGRQPALLLEEVRKTCPGCESGVRVPLTLAALFRGRTLGL